MNQTANDTKTGPEGAPQNMAYRVYSIIERPGEQKNYWMNIGAAWRNRDDSLTCTLNCLPLDGKLQLRIPNDKNGGNAKQLNSSSPKSWQREGF